MGLCDISRAYLLGGERELVWEWNAASLSIPFECCWYGYWHWNWNYNLCRYLEVTVA